MAMLNINLNSLVPFLNFVFFNIKEEVMKSVMVGFPSFLPSFFFRFFFFLGGVKKVFSVILWVVLVVPRSCFDRSYEICLTHFTNLPPH